MSKMKAYYKHELSGLTANATAANFDVENVLSLLENSFWKGVGVGDHTITFDAGAGNKVAIDYIGMATHNLGGATLQLQYSDTDFGEPGTEISSFQGVSNDSPDGIHFSTTDGTLWLVDNGIHDDIINYEVDGTEITSFATSVFDASATDTKGITEDPATGTLWVVDNNTNKVYNIQKDGTWISEFLTTGFDASATTPTGIGYATADDTLYITDDNTNKIYKVSTSGTWISEFPTSDFDAGATGPQGVSESADATTLWVTDANDKIYNIPKTGDSILLEIDFSSIGGFFAPGVSEAPNGTLWVARGDTGTGAVNYVGYEDVNEVVEPLISSLTPAFVPGSPSSGQADIAYAANGTLWVTTDNSKDIYNVNRTTGATISTFSTNSFYSGSPPRHYGITEDMNGSLWMCDWTTSTVYNMSNTGTWISEFHSSLFSALSVNLTGISFAPDGTLWVIDSLRDKIYNITTLGAPIKSFSTVSGIPRGVAYDTTTDTLWYTELGGDRIYNITTDGDLISSIDTNLWASLQPWGNAVGPDGTIWSVDWDSGNVYNVYNPYAVAEGAFIRDFDIISARYWRVNISELTAVPLIGILYWGRKVEWGFPDFFDPNAEDNNAIVNVSPTGFLLGINNKFVERNIDIGFTGVVDGSTLWNALYDWWTDHGLQSLFISIDIENRPQDVFFVYPDPKFKGPLITPVYRNVSLKFKGRV